MEQKLYDNYVAILNSELMPAFGCTEPIAIALMAKDKSMESVTVAGSNEVLR